MAHEIVQLPLELRLRVLSLLSANELALGGRLSCREAAAHFSQLHHRTASYSQALPPYAAAPLEAALRHLTLRQKLQLLLSSPKCGIEGNVDFLLQVLEPQLIPELLRNEHYRGIIRVPQPAADWKRTYPSASTDMGSAAVAGGLARLLPSLLQRCPGLVDPPGTLEAAARLCSLAEVKAMWELFEPRLETTPDWNWTVQQQGPFQPVSWESCWRRATLGAVASKTADAWDKVDWVLGQSHEYFVREPHAYACGAASASGDMGLLELMWGEPWGTEEIMGPVLLHADADFLDIMEIARQYLPSPALMRRDDNLVRCAAASPRDSAAKIRWLAARGVTLGSYAAIPAAAAQGNLEALQILVDQNNLLAVGGEASWVLHEAMQAAVRSGSIPVVAWLHHEAGCPLSESYHHLACMGKHLPMLRWLLEAGCPHGVISNAVRYWRSRTPGHSERLVEAVQLLAAAGWPLTAVGAPHPLVAAAEAGHPWCVWQALRELMPEAERAVPYNAAEAAAATAVRRRWRPWWGWACARSVGPGWQRRGTWLPPRMATGA